MDFIMGTWRNRYRRPGVGPSDANDSAAEVGSSESPRSYSSSIPDPKAPRTGSAIEEANQQHALALHYRRGSDSTVNVPVATASLEHDFARACITEQDSTHRLEKGLELGSALDEHVAGPAAPEIRYEPAEVITDPLLYTQGHNARARIYSNINDKTQRLDPRFVVQKKRFFVPGRVIKVLWPELAGNTGDSLTAVTLTSRKFKDVQIIERIRWFVVVKTGHSASTCLPISTYGGRGVAKPNVFKAQHCIVYTDRHPPHLLPGESPKPGEQPMRAPIRINPTTRGDRMELSSRLNYGKMYTLEHNVRVYDFGMVRSDYIQILTGQWISSLAFELGQPLGNSTSGPYNQASGDGNRPQPVSRSSSQHSNSVQEDPILSESYSKQELPDSLLPLYVDFGCASDRYVPPPDETSRQISVEKGDQLSIIDWPFGDWAMARSSISGKTGLVPHQYITLYPSATALYTWSNEDRQSYVDIEKDDELRVIEYPHQGWAVVWNRRTADTGLVPLNYIETAQ